MASGTETFHSSDEELMARFQRGLEPSVFTRLADRYLARAMAVARRILSDSDLAEDAVQEAFLKVIRSRDRYDPGKPFSVWFYTILRNVCLDIIRRRKREARTMRDIAVHADWTAPAPADPPETEQLLASLPRLEQEAITLRIVHDLSMADVAAALGITEEAAKKRVQRGLRRLRDRMGASKSDRPDPDRSPAAV